MSGSTALEDPPDKPTAEWISEKAWAEACFLRYSLVWPILFGGWCMSGWHLLFGDMGNLAGAPPPPASPRNAGRGAARSATRASTRALRGSVQRD